MNRKIARNIALVSAVFIVTFSIMLITNYFQVRGVNPLQTEVVETLKEINDANSENTKLQEQIRQLDLLARRAYFIRTGHLRTGVYLLTGMLVVFIIAARYYFAEIKNIPKKEIDPIDEWAEKTLARKYVNLTVGGLVVAALVFAFLSSPFLNALKNSEGKEEQTEIADVEDEEISVGEDDGAVGNNELLAENSTESSSENSIKPSTGNSAESSTENSIKPSTGNSTESSTENSTEPSTENSTESSTENSIKPQESIEDRVPPVSTNSIKAKSTDSTKANEPVIPKVTHTSFRGNNSLGITSAKNIPTKWDLTTDENIAWKADIVRHGYNSPVISGNKVFITGADEQARELYCYDLNTGALLWKVAADNIPGSPAQTPATSEDTGLAASTVTTNGKQVCAIFATGDLIATDMEGKRLWVKNLGVPVNHYGYASSLLSFGNTVIVQYDNTNSPRILALDMATGAVRWDKPRTDKITWSSPVIAYINRKPQLILMGNPSISSYNPNNGEKNWSVDFLSGEVASSPCSADGLVFGASEYASLVAVDAVSGAKLWEANDFLPEVSSPVATKDNVFLATSYGVVACYDAKSGELKKSLETNTEFYSSPVIAEGKIYLFSNSGTAFVYSANSELALISSFETGQRTFATPAFTDNRMIVRSENQLYCVTKK